MQPVAQRTVAVVVPKKDVDELKMDFAVPASLYGPLAPDQTVGQVIVRDRSEVVATFEAVSPLPAGQQPAMVEAPSAPMAEVANERGATIRVTAPAGEVAAPAIAVPTNAAAAIAAQMNAPVASMNAAVAPSK
jgi:hypothetical protein